ncbi:MAG: hypothetical protein SLAVMIC_00074 [uncultured marine phage]|uniref:Uncharacterized protein n=1 Tax=uncultured marine phage TaxID=707152 RepID=A0A8D9FR92_9VIRU|nr:MAG: hypothetical protein SLAVMIC_00074 [uncultured marine phage]
MKKLKRFNEFFDSEKLRDESGIELDFGGNFLTKYFKKKQNEKTLKSAAAEAMKGFSDINQKAHSMILYILRECPLLRTEYFDIKGGKSISPNDENMKSNVVFDYYYKHEETEWRLLIIINLKKLTVMTSYQADIYGFDVISGNDIMRNNSIEEMTVNINNLLVPKILEWGKETFEMTKVNPIPYTKEELFSPGNN